MLPHPYRGSNGEVPSGTRGESARVQGCSKPDHHSRCDLFARRYQSLFGKTIVHYDSPLALVKINLLEEPPTTEGGRVCISRAGPRYQLWNHFYRAQSRPVMPQSSRA